VVYQSDFTGADLTSAGLVASAGAAGGSWTLDTINDEVDGVGGGNARSNLTTTNSWQSDSGFTLDVTFLNSANMTRYSFGLVDADYAISASGDWLNSSLAGAYGIGFSTAGSGTSDYLGFNNDAGTVTTLSTNQGDIANAVLQTMSITVTSNSWSYSLNGAAATTGSHDFDTSRSYVFTAHAHPNNLAHFQNITIREFSTGYQSNFDTATDLADAGLTTKGVNGLWQLDTANDWADGVATAYNPRAGLYTADSWQSDGGFTLDVTFRNSVAMTRYSFGLVDAAWTTSGSADWLNQSVAGAYGIGFHTAGEAGADGLSFNNDAGVLTSLSTAQGTEITGGANQTMSITVTSNSWSYSLNGAPATTGSHTFDTSRRYRFAAWSQLVSNSNISNITLAPYVAPPDIPSGTVIFVY